LEERVCGLEEEVRLRVERQAEHIEWLHKQGDMSATAAAVGGGGGDDAVERKVEEVEERVRALEVKGSLRARVSGRHYQSIVHMKIRRIRKSP
jgi:hypothetical protein